MKNFILYLSVAALLTVACTKEPPEKPPEEIPVICVTLDLNSTSLFVGQTLALDAAVKPDGAANKAVKWSTEDNRIATINSEGKVTAIAPGAAKITVTSVDGGFTATCTVSVEPSPAESVVGIITMNTLASEVSFEITASRNNINVNWGDGKESNTEDAFFDVFSGRLTFSHSYSSASEHRITITDHNIAPLTTKGTKESDSDDALTHLDCRNNQLTNLDVSSFTALTLLSCDDNQLKNLDLSFNIALSALWCSNNQLTSLDLSRNTSLRVIDCSINQLIYLDVSHNKWLTYLFCGYNKLNDDSLNELFRTLQNRGSIKIDGNPGESDCDFSIAEERGWVKFSESGK